MSLNISTSPDSFIMTATSMSELWPYDDLLIIDWYPTYPKYFDIFTCYLCET